MGKYAHKGQILPLVNQMIPISKDTTFHASYDYGLHGFNQGERIDAVGPEHILSFDGTDSFIELPDPDGFMSDSFSIEISFSVGEWKNPYQSLFSIRTGPSWNNLSIVILRNGSSNNLLFSVSGGVGATTSNCSTPSLSLNIDYHLVATFESGTMRLYLDGVLVDEYQTTIVPRKTGNTMASIGYASSSYYWAGTIYDVAFYDKALSGSEVEERIDKKAPMGYWKLNEREGPIAFDHSGNGNDGTWNGGVASAYGPTVVSKVEGKFRKGALIEPDSENLAPYTDYSNRVYGQNYTATSWSGDAATVAYYAGGGYGGLPYRKMHKDGGGTGGSYIDDHRTFSLVDGKTYTVSAWMKADGPVVLNGYAIALNRGADNKYIAMGDYPLTTEWQRFSYTFTTVAGDAGDWQNRSIVYIDEDLPIEIYWCGFQVEERATATSYWKNSRPLGRLWYPKELLNPNEFSVSFWFNLPHVHKTSTGNAGYQGSWYHEIFSIAPPRNVGDVNILSFVCTPQANYTPTRKLEIRSHNSNVNSVTSINDGEWYHATLTYDGVNYKVYVNGVLEMTVPSGTPIAPYDDSVLMIGGGYRGKPHAIIDELRIESRAISAEEAAAWAASGLHYNYLDYSMIAD